MSLATAIREPAVAIGAVLGLLYPSAGLAIQATANLRDMPVGPWAAFRVALLLFILRP
jgi:hypothetical protein